MLAFKPTGSLPLRQNRSNLIGMVDISGVSRTALPEATPCFLATTPPVSQPLFVSGKSVMGSDPARSVVNRYSQTHDVDNLFIGGGVFPTSSCVNSTFTLHATSLMSAQ